MIKRNFTSSIFFTEREMAELEGMEDSQARKDRQAGVHNVFLQIFAPKYPFKFLNFLFKNYFSFQLSTEATQSLQYRPGEPKVWAVKTFGGIELEICNSLNVKLAYMLNSDKSFKPTIFSAFASENIKSTKL